MKKLKNKPKYKRGKAIKRNPKYKRGKAIKRNKDKYSSLTTLNYYFFTIYLEHERVEDLIKQEERALEEAEFNFHHDYYELTCFLSQ
ncbi:HEPN domain-containing protein [Acidianus manzaensis]|uniref:HEPN domain-containing protein n=1 Tax=Acidianus manzaensis TaxID=282676 RepID=UPI001F446A47|nr:HEPN domain-containing protein [Acidianus manzaensis]